MSAKDSIVSARAASTPKPLAMRTQSRSGLPRSKRVREAGGRADRGELAVEDGVAAVGQDHGGDVEALTGLGP